MPAEADSTSELPAEWRHLCPEPQADSELEDDGRITVLEPKFTGPILGRWLQPRLLRPVIRTHLDEVGSVVWQACDGGTTVAAIADQLTARFGADFDPDHRRLTTFLQAMARRRLIRFR